jgi:hypothetical protein
MLDMLLRRLPSLTQCQGPERFLIAISSGNLINRASAILD